MPVMTVYHMILHQHQGRLCTADQALFAWHCMRAKGCCCSRGMRISVRIRSGSLDRSFIMRLQAKSQAPEHGPFKCQVEFGKDGHQPSKCERKGAKPQLVTCLDLDAQIQKAGKKIMEVN